MEKSTLSTLILLLKGLQTANAQTELLNLGIVQLDDFFTKVEQYYHLPKPLCFDYDVATLDKLSAYIDKIKTM